MTKATVTRTCQQFRTADLVAVLEDCWAAIRHNHSEVPAAVLVVASGSPARTGQAMKWGHFASLRWQHGQQRIPEVLVSGEGLSRTPKEVLTTLLHEAAHGLADARQIKDTSRQGRWHNKNFAALASELGLSASKHDKFGWSVCTMTDPTAELYAPGIKALAKVLGIYRHPEPTGEAKERNDSNNGLSCLCECGRKIRVAKTVWEAGPILCAVCDGAFQPDSPDSTTGGAR